MLTARGGNGGQPAAERAAAERFEADYVAKLARAKASGSSFAGPSSVRSAAEDDDDDDDSDDPDYDDAEGSVVSSAWSGSSLSEDDVEEDVEEEVEEEVEAPPPKKVYKPSRPVLLKMDGSTLKFSEAVAAGFQYKFVHRDRLRTNACAVEDLMQVRCFIHV